MFISLPSVEIAKVLLFPSGKKSFWERSRLRNREAIFPSSIRFVDSLNASFTLMLD